jgi:hypothetical protein
MGMRQLLAPAVCAAVTVSVLGGCSSDADPIAAGPTATTTAAAPTPTTPTTPAPATTEPDPTPAPLPTRGLPPGVAGVGANPTGLPGAGLTSDGRLWVVTYGSSSNPLTVAQVDAQGQTVTVYLTQRDGPARSDLVPTTTTLDLPEGVDPDRAVTVDLPGFGSVELDPPTPGRVVWATAG